MSPEERERVNEAAVECMTAGGGIAALGLRATSYTNNGIYRHYKGGLYWLLDVARTSGKPDDIHARTVIYVTLLADEGGTRSLYARDYAEFVGEVPCCFCGGSGRKPTRVPGETMICSACKGAGTVPRFVWLGYSLPEEGK